MSASASGSSTFGEIDAFAGRDAINELSHKGQLFYLRVQFLFLSLSEPTPSFRRFRFLVETLEKHLHLVQAKSTGLRKL